jgi:outer membrane protein assembly factor BamB
MPLNSKMTTHAARPHGSTGHRIGWPQPRFDAARTAYNSLETTLNAGNVAGLQPMWRKSQPYFDNFDLVAANGLLYQGGTDGKSIVASSLDAGKVRWRFVPGDFVLISPVVGPRFVYAASTALYALDPATGQLRWRFIPPNHRAVSSTPVVSGRLLFVPICPIQDGPRAITQPCSLYALSASTGRKLRVYSDPDGAMPAIANGALYLTTQGTVQAISIANGHRVWNFSPPIGAKGQYHLAGNDVAVSNGVVYAAGDYSDTVYALDATTGRELWWFRAGLRHGQFTDSALAYGNIFVGQIGEGPKAGLYSLNGRSGHVNWVFKDKYGFETGPSVANGVVYAADPDSGLFALSSSTGQRLWSATVNHTGNISHVASDPIVVNGMLFLDRSPHGVFAYGLRTRS